MRRVHGEARPGASWRRPGGVVVCSRGLALVHNLAPWEYEARTPSLAPSHSHLRRKLTDIMDPGERQSHEPNPGHPARDPAEASGSAAPTLDAGRGATPDGDLAGSGVATPADTPAVTPSALPDSSPFVAETGAQRFARGAHRTLLYFYVIATLVVLIFLIALVVANTNRVKVSWLFGSSTVSLVWLVLGSAILGLFLGMLVGALLRHMTRQPRGSK